jgi:cobalamin synthase
MVLVGAIITVAYVLFGALCFAVLDNKNASIGFVYGGFLIATLSLVLAYLRGPTFNVLSALPFDESHRKGLVRFFWVIAVVAICSILFADKKVRDGQGFASYVLFLTIAMWVVRELAIFHYSKRK